MVLSDLNTERQNRASSDLDKLSALEIATLMNSEDAKVFARRPPGAAGNCQGH